jgi:hypothetical protein
VAALPESWKNVNAAHFTHKVDAHSRRIGVLATKIDCVAS